ncbi:MAG: hypothetical protein HYW01_04730 [Deltaproteobacteria bacterium]|nr:hypothetical protein [Deltaproteobacteria bacterium]
MALIAIKSIGIWILLVLLAILNGGVREKLLVPHLGQQWAHPVSGLLVSIIIFVITLGVFPILGINSSYQAWLVGGIWLLLTVAFEFLFGHFVMGESLSKLLEAYDVLKGSLWLVVLVTTLISPYLAEKCED